jgi:hypothetical protein
MATQGLRNTHTNHVKISGNQMICHVFFFGPWVVPAHQSLKHPAFLPTYDDGSMITAIFTMRHHPFV